MTLMRVILWFFSLFLFAYCGGSETSSSQNPSTSSESSRLAISLIDASSESYKAVYITIDEVSVHKEDDGDESWRVILRPETTVNLLELVNGVREELGIVDLDTGHYTQLRLLIGNTPDDGINLLSQSHPFANYVIDTDNEVHELTVPSGEQTGVKIVQGFDVNANQTTELILDFDAAKSVVVAGNSGKYQLKPTIKMLVEEEASIIGGTVTQGSDQQVVSDARISAQRDMPFASDPKDQLVVETTTFSDTNGEYSFILTPATYILVAYKSGFMPAIAEVTTQASDVVIQDFSLSAAAMGTVSGTASISGASSDTFVTLSFRQTLPLNSSSVVVEIASVHVATGGQFTLSLPEGHYTLVSSTFGKPSQTTELDVVANATTTVTISF